MQAYVDAGLTTFDMADIYGPAEEIFGQFNSQVHSHTGVVGAYTRGFVSSVLWQCNGAGRRLRGSSGTVCREKQTAAEKLLRLFAL